MLLGSLLNGRRRKAREACFRSLLAEVNRNDYSRIETLVTEDIEFNDVGGARIKGRDAFVTGDRRFREATGNPELVIETLDHHGEELLARGRLQGGLTAINGPIMWQVYFREGKICCIDVTRADGQITMPAFAEKFVEHPA